MRCQLTQAASARVSIGGRVDSYAGLYPGIVEEAWMSIVAHQPLYLVGGFGGAARLVIDALLTGDAGLILTACRPAHMAECIDLCRTRGFEILDGLGVTQNLELARRLALPERIARDMLEARNVSLANALNNGLTDDENSELFKATEPTMIAELVLMGLSRLK